MRIVMEFETSWGWDNMELYLRNDDKFRIRLFFSDDRPVFIGGPVKDEFLKSFQNLIRRMKLEHVK